MCSGNPVHLVGSATLSTALCRVSPCNERQGVLVVDKLLGTEEVAQRVVGRTLDGTDTITPSIGKASGEGPAVFPDT